MAAIARTAGEIINMALRNIGVLAIGVDIAGDEATEALAIFRDLLSEIGADQSLIPSETIESHTLVASTASYTIGEDSADIDTVRPESINDAWIRDSDNHDHPVKIIGADRYNSLLDKTTENRPYFLWYNPTMGNGTIYLYPTPSTAENLYFVSHKPFVDVGTVNDNMLNTVKIPRALHASIMNMFSIRIAPKYGITAPSELLIAADQGLERITALNVLNNIATAKSDLPKTTDHARLISGEIPE